MELVITEIEKFNAEVIGGDKIFVDLSISLPHTLTHKCMIKLVDGKQKGFGVLFLED